MGSESVIYVIAPKVMFSRTYVVAIQKVPCLHAFVPVNTVVYHNYYLFLNIKPTGHFQFLEICGNFRLLFIPVVYEIFKY